MAAQDLRLELLADLKTSVEQRTAWIVERYPFDHHIYWPLFYAWLVRVDYEGSIAHVIQRFVEKVERSGIFAPVHRIDQNELSETISDA